ncbi:MAG TPA: aldolase/citrate lyase family protein [Streptosporangiaceae bacterium]|nr:aldolase/citrate lyase family protein [Streptosporangiaceae bacterium]
MPESITARVRGGEVVIGTFVFEFATAGIGRLAAGAGAEFVVYDGEHTGWSWETLGKLVATTRPTSAVPLIRIPGTDRTFVSRALDVGARGIIAPMVGTAEQARRIVEWAKYPPVGSRGAAFSIAHDDYAAGAPADKIAFANEDNLVITQIETAQGLENAEEIAGVDGVDVLWVGHFDLTNSMGIPGQFDHPDYFAALDRVSAAAKAHGKVAGFMPTDPKMAADLVSRGFTLLAYGGDLWVYQQALAAGIKEVRDQL